MSVRQAALSAHRHRQPVGLSRRQFIHVVGVAGAGIAVAKVLWPGGAAAAPGAKKAKKPPRKHTLTDPRPIPDTLPGFVFGDSSNQHTYHVLGFGDDGSGQFGDPSSIGDFKGKVADVLIEVTGTG